MSYQKYPKTPHLPWSMGVKSDDTIIDPEYLRLWSGRNVIVTEKMDGENTTMYSNYIHARSLDSKDHPSRSRVKAIHGMVKFSIPDGWRVCGENVSAVHSIRYENLLSPFLVFSVWTDENICLNRPELLEFCLDRGFSLVPSLFEGVWEDFIGKKNSLQLDLSKHEGYVVQPMDSFHFLDFNKNVAKFVRKDHVQTDEHWMNKKVEWNGFNL